MVLYVDPYCCQRCFACEESFHHIPELAYEGVKLGHWIEKDDIIIKILELKKNCPGHAMRLMTETEFKNMMKETDEGKGRCSSL